MKISAWRAPHAAAACACVFAFLSGNAQSAAPAGAWAKVPALPTACYSGADDFADKVEAARTALAEDAERQKGVNAQIEEQFNNIDPMEKAQRMQQWMMSNPQEAMAMMQAAQQAGATAATTDLQTAVQQQKAKEAPWNALVKGYEDARIAAYAPFEPRRKALAASAGYEYSAARKDLLHPVAHPGETVAAWPEAEALNAQYDRAYQSICPQWWGANGKFHVYLKQERDRLIRERVPELAQSDAPKLQQYAIMNTPAATYRSTAQLQAVNEYLATVQKVYNLRDSNARCTRPRISSIRRGTSRVRMRRLAMPTWPILSSPASSKSMAALTGRFPWGGGSGRRRSARCSGPG